MMMMTIVVVPFVTGGSLVPGPCGCPRIRGSSSGGGGRNVLHDVPKE